MSAHKNRNTILIVLSFWFEKKEIKDDQDNHYLLHVYFYT